jgi:hypothetical protein
VLGTATVLLVGTVACLVTRWGAITASQPAYLVTLVVVGLASALGVAWSLIDPGSRRRRALDRPRWRVVTARVVGVTATIALLVGLAWLRPLPATAVAVDAMSGGPAVRVVDGTSRIELVPTGHAAATGLVFFPGALVDPRAYVPLLTPMADHGFTVDIVKPPYGIAFLASGAPGTIIASHPDISRWVVGGHSLGGVVAAAYAGGGHAEVRGLLLWASYPNGSIAGATSLAVTSVSAGNDGLATPARIEASEPDLPPDTVFVVVAGAVHADFGDYGPQRGDGTPTVGRARARAQDQIVTASLALLERVDRDAG